MDPLSTIASIIAVLGVLASATKAAQNVWGAPDELQQLAADLSELNELASRLDALTKDRRFGDNDLRSLETPDSKLQEAQKVFQERLSKRTGLKSPASRFRRRTWILHRASIKKVTRDVATIRTQLSAAIQSFTFSSVLSIRSIQGQHSHALTLVDGQVLRCQSLLHSLTERELCPVHKQKISRTRSTINDPALDHETQELQVEAVNIDDSFECESRFSESKSEAVQFYTPYGSLLDCPIETSTACYPEDYVTEGPLYERLACFSMIELSKTSAARVDKYFLLFAQGGRHWWRVTVSATTTTPSRQWDTCFSFAEIYHHVFPYLVQSKLETMLERAQLYDSVTNISVKLQLSKTGDITFDPERSLIIEDVEDAATTETSRRMEEIEQRGIRPHVESQVGVLSRIRTTLYNTPSLHVQN